MLLITENIIETHSAGSVVTIGNFDGVHIGHQKLIESCKELAQGKLDVAVVTFEPSPQHYFSSAEGPAKLSGKRQKTGLLEKTGVDLLWMMRFNQQLAEMSAAEFAEKVLSDALAVKFVVTGKDFRFGHRREGDVGLMRQLGKQLGFAVRTVEDLEFSESKVSSTLVRSALAEGKFDLAEAYLGRRYTSTGVVVEGKKLGRKLGYPTANMKPEAEPFPLSGVFAVRSRQIEDGRWMNGVASLGTRPAVDGQEFLIEVHFFDCSPDLYGKTMEVDYVEKIRDEECFDSMDALIVQMKKDELKARQILN
jgi:riboflavin kinase/FMN adenylyltransferase